MAKPTQKLHLLVVQIGRNNSLVAYELTGKVILFDKKWSDKGGPKLEVGTTVLAMCQEFDNFSIAFPFKGAGVDEMIALFEQTRLAAEDALARYQDQMSQIQAHQADMRRREKALHSLAQQVRGVRDDLSQWLSTEHGKCKNEPERRHIERLQREVGKIGTIKVPEPQIEQVQAAA